MRRGTVAAVLAGGAARPVDLVLADPPYDVADAEIEAMLAALTTGGWAAPGTVVVVERAASGPALAWPDGWQPWPCPPLRRHPAGARPNALSLGQRTR